MNVRTNRCTTRDQVCGNCRFQACGEAGLNCSCARTSTNWAARNSIGPDIFPSHERFRRASCTQMLKGDVSLL
jgi:hypothetical protein